MSAFLKAISPFPGLVSNRRSARNRVVRKLQRFAPLLLVFAVIFVTTRTAFAKDDVSGFIALQSKANNHHDGESAVIARIRYETPRVDGNRAVITAEGNYYDRTLVLEDTYIDRKLSPQVTVVAGIVNKTLGLEYTENKVERYTIHRSPIYQKMESLGLVGRQLTLRVTAAPGKRKKDSKWSAALGTDGSRDFNLAISFERQKNGLGMGAWFLAEARKSSVGYQPVFANVLSLWAQNERRRLVLELFQGIDPDRSEFAKTIRQQRRVMFLGSKVELVRYIDLGQKIVFSPLFQASLWLDDATEPREYSRQALLGARLQRGALRVSINGVVKGGRAYDERVCYAEALLTF
jgi:hypothetical protein